MKKIFFALALSSLFVLSGCSETQEDSPELTTEYEYNIRKALNGTFHGERFSTSTNVRENEDIRFEPFDRPRKEVSGFGTFTAYGIAVLTQYLNDNTPTGETTCLYSLNTGSEPFTLSFYPYREGQVVSREDRRTIEFETPDLFCMRRYGTTPENNLTYTRQK
ncbi:MAG: membrane lipoprotein lipid attachment site-containing protein [Prevotella sp.]|nr:membrane lipoprotein lipid attachment site-containing protein [Prevotella sp.]